jgi:hypothetical protein
MLKIVKKTEEIPVYDFTVEENHNFYCNDVLVHNCAEILGNDLHCVSGDTKLITRDGIHSIKDIAYQEVEVWNGTQWSTVTPIKTGELRQLYRVTFGDGTYLDTTDYHNWYVRDRFQKSYTMVPTNELMSFSKYPIHTEPFTIKYEDGIDTDLEYAYTLGFAVGDGSANSQYPTITLYGTNKCNLEFQGHKYEPSWKHDTFDGDVRVVSRLPFTSVLLKSLKNSAESLLSIGNWSRTSILKFIAGLADSDGSNVVSGGIRIYISQYERAYAIHLLLVKCGIRSSIVKCAESGQITNYGQRKNDLYAIQITDCSDIPCKRLDVSRGHTPKYKGKYQVIKSVEKIDGLHDTYCFNEPLNHKGVFGSSLTGNCNLSEVHLNQIGVFDYDKQHEAFYYGGVIAATLLKHVFLQERYRRSRELDPIVGVSFTGLFDFFVHAFGTRWLKWWEQGRPATAEGFGFRRREAEYLSSWKKSATQGVWDYCDEHGLKRPNRCTTVQPAGTKSLLTGASSGWHPPKAARFIRRITFRREDPVALACMDYGYNVIPSQSDKDENGRLLDNPFDPRVTEWLVEIPTAVSWANIPGADEVDISKFSAAAQFDFYMQVQKYYTAHNTSATIEFRENEIEELSQCIYESIRDHEGYISAALLARFDANETFPRLPFEPISEEKYNELMDELLDRQMFDDFSFCLMRHDSGVVEMEGPAGCDSSKCLFEDKKPE